MSDTVNAIILSQFGSLSLLFFGLGSKMCFWADLKTVLHGSEAPLFLFTIVTYLLLFNCHFNVFFDEKEVVVWFGWNTTCELVTRM